MHFTPNRNDIVPNDGTLLLTLNGSVIKCVIETKFLGVIIDDKLEWQSHTSYLNYKLKYEIGKLHRMKSFIPKHLYKDMDSQKQLKLCRFPQRTCKLMQLKVVI